MAGGVFALHSVRDEYEGVFDNVQAFTMRSFVSQQHLLFSPDKHIEAHELSINSLHPIPRG